MLTCHMPEPKFNAGDFIRRLESGEFDGALGDELDKLTPFELEELALMLASRSRAKATGVD